ncbi:hypothetical protein BH11ACT6_BH11ACT6_32310 [soil metagenome]
MWPSAFRRPTTVAVQKFVGRSDGWAADRTEAVGVSRDRLTVATYNIWFNDKHAEARYRAIADLLGRDRPDVMAFQEVTPMALAVFREQPWVREYYLSAAMTGAGVGNYGLLLLSRLPLDRVTYTKLPTRLSRGYLTAELTVNGEPLSIVAVHLESGKAATHLRSRQLGRLFDSHQTAENVIVMGDLNMRDTEDHLLDPDYRDVWPVLRPGDPGFTEDTSINLMRYDMKDKHRHVRFDRVLVKGQAWVPKAIELLGREPIADDLPRVFPSDHFGVLCDFTRGS